MWGEDGVADFERIHARIYDHVAILYAFDLLEHEGDDLRSLPLSERKKRLQRVLKGQERGILFNAQIAADGDAVFEHACRMGLEGIVCKRLDSPYRSGRSKTWLKVKNPASPAVLRFEQEPG